MWRVIPVILSLLLLGAHFLRAGAHVPLAACAVLIAMLAVPRWWAARIVRREDPAWFNRFLEGPRNRALLRHLGISTRKV